MFQPPSPAQQRKNHQHVSQAPANNPQKPSIGFFTANQQSDSAIATNQSNNSLYKPSHNLLEKLKDPDLSHSERLTLINELTKQFNNIEERSNLSETQSSPVNNTSSVTRPASESETLRAYKRFIRNFIVEFMNNSYTKEK